MTRLLDAVIVLLAAALLLILSIGGIDHDFGPLQIRLHDWTRPLALLAIAAGARVAIGARGGVRRLDSAAICVASLGLLALLVAVAVVYAQHHIRVAGGLDSYGYVSSASLLASGRLSEPQRLVSLLPFASASTAAAPLGYVPGPDRQSSVPRFPLGFPAVMAPFTILGAAAPFFVPLIMALVTIALAYQLGREPGWPLSGLLAAVLAAVDPLVMSYAIQPMSDVPATCWLLAALWLRLEHPAWPIAAGVCAGMALVTRPALLPAALVLVLVTAGPPLRRSAALAGAVLAFVALQAALNASLYGSAATSGYGTASHMFELSFTRLRANTSNFGKWLTYSHSPLFWLLWPAALGVLRHHKPAWQMSAVAAASAAPYLFYLVFDDWESSRFLLPAIVIVVILAARAIARLLAEATGSSGTRRALGAAAVLAIAFGCATASHRFLSREGMYHRGTLEAKYALVGEWFKTHTSDRAVALAGLHSGSIRLYGLRETIRWDEVPAGALAPTLRNLIEEGYEPYLVLDQPSEPPLFTDRFRSEADVKIEQIARVRVADIYRFVSAP